MLTTFSQCDFGLEFPEIPSQNLICYHWPSVSGNSKLLHCGILINMPFGTMVNLWECSRSLNSQYVDLLLIIGCIRLWAVICTAVRPNYGFPLCILLACSWMKLTVQYWLWIGRDFRHGRDFRQIDQLRSMKMALDIRSILHGNIVSIQ